MKTNNSNGTIYYDNGSKGIKNGKRVYHDCYRAEIIIDGVRYRHREKDARECRAWLNAVKSGKLKPTDKDADWWRMEQRKDEQIRIEEIIVSQAEEATLLYDYHQSKDIEPIFNYVVNRLLPHIAYYSFHTLHMGRDKTITASIQAVGLLLTRIVSGRPVMNFTASCKRMMRTYKERGDFFFYENAPKEVKMMANKIDFSPLMDVWKVVKDRRI